MQAYSWMRIKGKVDLEAIGVNKKYITYKILKTNKILFKRIKHLET